MKFRCPKFNLHDQELIQNARTTGEPAHISQAIEAAVAGFKARLDALPNGIPIIEGRPSLMIKKPGNFFDEYVIKLALQEIADDTGKVVDLYKVGEKIQTDTTASPDVEMY